MNRLPRAGMSLECGSQRANTCKLIAISRARYQDGCQSGPATGTTMYHYHPQLNAEELKQVCAESEGSSWWCVCLCGKNLKYQLSKISW